MECLAQSGELHGFEITKRLEQRGGTVYPILWRWAASGHVTMEKEQLASASREKRPRRIYYRITDKGIQTYNDLAQSRNYTDK